MIKLQEKIQTVLALYKSRNLVDAEKLCKDLIKQNPKQVYLYNLLGLILAENRKTEEAIEYYNSGLKIDPKNPSIYNNLGNLYKSINDYDLAESYFIKSINLDEKISEHHNNLGNLYLDLNKFNEAIKSFKKAIKHNAQFFPSYYNLGILHINIGKFDLAKIYLTKAINLNNYLFSAHRSLSQITKYNAKDKHFNLLKKIYSNSKMDNAGQSQICFALGKAYDDCKNYNKAFHYYKIGNDLRRKSILFFLNDEKEEFDTIKKIFNKEMFKFKDIKFNKSQMPIFIVGMPRSGTTLIEQVISSHPDVYGGDELNYLPNLVKKYIGNFTNFSPRDNNLNNLANSYISCLKKISNNSKKVTDKLPINFKYIGLLKMIMPNCKIIHCSRNPRDICLSIFKNYFVNPNLNFAYNLNEMCEYYKLYFDMMKYWNKLFPNYIYNVKYENVVKNPNHQIPQLINFCNLKWDKRCLSFYNNKRAIKTASHTQARKKIYKTSLNTWLNYKSFLSDNFKNLPE